MVDEGAGHPSSAIGPAVRRCRHGLMMFLRNDNHIGRSLDLYGEYSPLEVELFAQLVRPGDWVVDAGANIGALTVPLAGMVGPEGLVLAFEPQRPLFHMLCGNLALNGIEHVIARCAAVGAREGTIGVPKLDYRLTDNFGALALLEGGGTPTPLRTIDGLQLDRLRLLKIDVEGAELEVLRGASQTIARLRPILYVENDRRDKSSALIAALEAMGYRLWWHPAPLFRPDNFRGDPVDVFGKIMSMNMIGLPPDATLTGTRLPAVSGPADWGYDRFGFAADMTVFVRSPPG